VRYRLTATFKRCNSKLPPDRQKAVRDALASLDEALLRGQPSSGLGLKQLRRGFWEIRAGISDRVVFYRAKDCIEFLIVGSHDDIRRFLKRL